MVLIQAGTTRRKTEQDMYIFCLGKYVLLIYARY